MRRNGNGPTTLHSIIPNKTKGIARHICFLLIYYHTAKSVHNRIQCQYTKTYLNQNHKDEEIGIRSLRHGCLNCVRYFVLFSPHSLAVFPRMFIVVRIIKHNVKMNTKASHALAAFGPKLKSSKGRNVNLLYINKFT